VTPWERYHRLRRARTGRPDATPCPPSDCTTCRPEPRPLDAVAEQQHARDLAYTIGWLLERYPDAWYRAEETKLRAFAAGILEIKLRVLAGRDTP
jgi:hypothetical protein